MSRTSMQMFSPKLKHHYMSPTESFIETSNSKFFTNRNSPDNDQLTNDLNSIEEFVDYLKDAKHYSNLYQNKKDKEAKKL